MQSIFILFFKINACVLFVKARIYLYRINALQGKCKLLPTNLTKCNRNTCRRRPNGIFGAMQTFQQARSASHIRLHDPTPRRIYLKFSFDFSQREIRSVADNRGYPLVMFSSLVGQRSLHSSINLAQKRKLFVGMLSKKFTENDVRNMFSAYGMIEECSVLRDSTGKSKACAFVTFASKQYAINAIKALHHSQTMEGCSSPLVVKFADTQKEKDQKRMQQLQSNLWNIAGVNIAPHYLTNDAHTLAPASLQLLQQLQATTSAATPVAANAGAANALSNVQHQLLLQQHLGLGAATPAHAAPPAVPSPAEINPANLQSLATLASLSNTAANAGVSPMSMQNLVTLAAMTGGNGNLQVSPNTLSGLANSTAAALLGKTGNTGSTGGSLSPVTSLTLNSLTGTPLNGLQDSLSNAYSSLQQYAALIGKTTVTVEKKELHRFPAFTAAAAAAAAATQKTKFTNTDKQIEGPEGCNLFIYHLPQEFSDTDLISTFLPFGNVISAKVFIDKHTHMSKCFGFVSYDNAASAQVAIQTMHGFQIGMKRLKVQLKRSKDASKPY
ncbi:hypothetical protein ACFW04_000089 [Cataglyphis niger]